MEVGNQIEKFKIWAESKDLLLIEGYVNSGTQLIVDFHGSQESAFTDFKKVANKLNIGIIFYVYQECDVKIIDVYEKEVYNPYVESIKEIYKTYMNDLNSLRNSIDKYLFFKAFMIQDGVIYKYEIESDLRYAYLHCQEEVHNLKDKPA